MVSGHPDEDVVPATDHASGVADYREEARRAAARYGLDPGVFERQIQQESGFNPTIRSPAGAVGIAQIMPATARGWGVDPLNPTAALDAAAKNMAAYVKKYGGIENALRAYNAGPGAIKASHGYAETNAYVKRILGGGAPVAAWRGR
jgi:soluble lytic murein transglycosylase-like protein